MQNQTMYRNFMMSKTPSAHSAEAYSACAPCTAPASASSNTPAVSLFLGAIFMASIIIICTIISGISLITLILLVNLLVLVRLIRTTAYTPGMRRYA